ncbi:MAG: aminopeptidase P N-terminal domain-containing protein [Bacteroidia bacterium]|nr:aminopeptidase P N-terminal domain-containing protein [Bacteroidia bacterium]
MKNLRFVFLPLFLLVSGTLQSQNEIPADYLSAEFHQGRRDALRALMPAHSVAVFFAAPVRNRANDVDYIYHQNPDFYYLTGYREPHSLLLLFSEDQKTEDGSCREILFVQPRNKIAEMWNGRRLGDEGVKTTLGLNCVYKNAAFEAFPLDWGGFEKVFFFPFKDDIRNTGDPADLYDLTRIFREKTADLKNKETNKLREMMETLREIKTPEEMALMRKAINISAIAQKEVMKAMHSGMSESEVQGIHEFVYKKYGAEYEGYPSIVGAGENGCILHYTENIRPRLNNDLVLMDLGAEYHGYTADVTRTIPASGRFSPEQKALYDLVYEAQEAAFAACKPGNSFSAPHIAAKKIIDTGLANLGIIQKDSFHTYFPHGTSHFLGLDVHDRGRYGPLKPQMVITVEPGIYIPHGSPCDPKWWGIGVRIEDDILITETGYENLSVYAPRKSEEIEAIMAEPSPLDDFVLPALDQMNH